MKKNIILKRVISFTLFILLFINGLAQSRMIVSPNSRFFALEEFNGKKDENGIKVYEFEYKIYHFQSKKILHSFFIHSKSKEQPNKVQFSPDGKLFSVKQLHSEKKLNLSEGLEKVETMHHVLKIWDVRTGNVITEDVGYDDLELVFFNQSHYYLLISKDEMKSFDTQKGSKILDFKYAKGTKISKAFVSEDDKYIVVINTLGQAMIWSASNPRVLKRISGNDIKFSYNAKLLIAYRVSGPNVYTTVYKLPNFERVKSTNAGKVLRDLAKKERDKIKADNPDIKNIILPSYRIDGTKSSFGPYGKYMVAYAERLFKEPEMLEKKLIFIENATGKAVYEIAETNNELSLFPYTWAGNSIFLLQADSFNIDVLNLKAEQFVQDLELDMEYKPNEKAIPLDKQLKYRKVSANKRFVIVPDLNSKANFYVQCTFSDSAKTLIKNLQFIDFSPNSRLMFFKNNANELIVVSTSELERFGGKTLDYNTLKAMPDTLKTPENYIFHEFLPGLTEKEELIEEDIEMPSDFYYDRVGNIREISSFDQTDQLFLNYKALELYHEKVGIQFHFTDYFGNFVQGVGNELFKKNWCNLIIESPDGKIKQIDDFEVIENSVGDTMKTAIAVVLDHSGSIGADRAKKMQDGTLQLIKALRKEDALAIVKFDHNVGIESELSNDKDFLTKQLTMNGIGRFGGTSSLLDAINSGISLVNNATDYPKKAVIVITDGFENSSYISKNELITRAIQSNVSLNVIHLGYEKNFDFLSGIAYHTEGQILTVFNRQDYKWIFTDLYKRLKNYYTIRFNTSLQGTYKVFAEVCLNKISTQKLAIEFEYKPVDLDNVSLYFDAKDAFLGESRKIDKTIASEAKYTFKPISDFSKIKILNPKGEIISLSGDTTTVISPLAEEFYSLNLPEIKFNKNEVNILDGTDEGIDEIANFMKKNRSVILEIASHTDDSGDSKRNLDLTERRAIVVKKKLIALGVDDFRIKINAFGSSKPLVPENSEENRNTNRRIEFKILNF